jgi:hypothetical protein
VDTKAQDPDGRSGVRAQRAFVRAGIGTTAQNRLRLLGRNWPSPSPASEPFDSPKGLDDASRPRKFWDGLEVQHFRGHTGRVVGRRFHEGAAGNAVRPR